jgi:hypothetical protein
MKNKLGAKELIGLVVFLMQPIALDHLLEVTILQNAILLSTI